VKSILSKLFWYPSSSKNRVEKFQKRIRNIEWEAIKHAIPNGAKMLDVGCGAGDNMLRAINELNCTCSGIDPDPGGHGVGRYNGLETEIKLPILQGFAENLPYEDKSFDVVFCSHVLEHVNDEKKSLEEINRVLKPNGILIIGMPTATVAALTWVSGIIFTSHISILFAIKSIGKPDFATRIRRIFVPDSHSKPRGTTVFYDLRHYRTKNWTAIVTEVFKIEKTIYPALYPMPDFPWWFPASKLNFTGSSVFFMARKK
jgi:SAM-dependent methyltransferase